MNCARTDGKSRFVLKAPETGLNYYISVVSRRCGILALEQSKKGKWKNPIIPYAGFNNIGGFILLGFQPETGLHIVIKDRWWENEL